MSRRAEGQGFLGEFKAFALRGNVVDLAVGVVLGVAFGAVVTSLVQDILTPLLGVFGTPDFKNDLIFRIGKGEFRVGLFLNAVVSLILVAAGVFVFVVKPINRITSRQKAGPPEEVLLRECPYCLSSIPKKATRCSACTADVPPAIDIPEPASPQE